ncbi:MAG: hypothetical protein EAZ36_03345 [Verrucomicrobia bacterium]|nr:MAG: hypothetical protein EAZ36_03345 [Verrucomicrobiota bacterium]
MPPHLPLFVSLSLGLALVAANSLSGRTLTSTDGRTIEVEILSFEGLDKVRFKRLDSAQVFTVPLTSFAEADRLALRAEAEAEAAKPPALDSDDLLLEFSRSRFDSRKTTEDVPLLGGGYARSAMETTDEDWGYTITLRNRTRFDISGLRAEYMLFVEVDQLKGEVTQGLRRQAGRMTFETIPANGQVAARSEAITTREVALKGNVRYTHTNDRKTADRLHGIWLKVYRGDELIVELSSPVGLAAKESWTVQ